MSIILCRILVCILMKELKHSNDINIFNKTKLLNIKVLFIFLFIFNIFNKCMKLIYITQCNLCILLVIGTERERERKLEG
jgi:hypothetical protein